MRAGDQSLNQFANFCVHNIVVRTLPRIPQFKPGVVDVANSEQDQPASLAQFGGGDPLQVEITYFGEDRYTQ
jgi:hypothetical protein